MGSLPPVHPAIVHLPIAFVVLSVAADLIGSWTRSASLRATGFWSLMAGAVTAVLAVLARYYDMNRATLSAETDGIVHLPVRIGWAVLVSVTLLALWRGWTWHRDRRAVSPPRAGPAYSLMALLVLGLVAFQGLVRQRDGLRLRHLGCCHRPGGSLRLWPSSACELSTRRWGLPPAWGTTWPRCPGQRPSGADRIGNNQTSPAAEPMPNHSAHEGSSTTTEALPTGRAR